jgi:hypothetical protein
MEKLHYYEFKELAESSNDLIIGFSYHEDSGSSFLLEEVLKNVLREISNLRVYKLDLSNSGTKSNGYYLKGRNIPLTLIYMDGKLKRSVMGLVGVKDIKRIITSLKESEEQEVSVSNEFMSR